MLLISSCATSPPCHRRRAIGDLFHYPLFSVSLHSGRARSLAVIASPPLQEIVRRRKYHPPPPGGGSDVGHFRVVLIDCIISCNYGNTSRLQVENVLTNTQQTPARISEREIMKLTDKLLY